MYYYRYPNHSIDIWFWPKRLESYWIFTENIQKVSFSYQKASFVWISVVNRSICGTPVVPKFKFCWGKMWEIFKSLSRNILKTTTPSWSPHMNNLRNFYDFYLFFDNFGPFGHIFGVSGVNRGICGTPEVPKFKFFLGKMWKIFKSFSRNILGTPTPSWNPHMKKSRNFQDF